MTSPIVSVVIPVFNRYERLLSALKSIKHPSYEVIIVDDGSDPPVKNFIKEADLIDHNALIVTKPNGGPASARNVAQTISKGKYIAYLDSDDLFYSDKLIRTVSILESYPHVHFAFSDISKFKLTIEGNKNFPNLHSDDHPEIYQVCKTNREIAKNIYLISSIEAFRLLTRGFAILPPSVIVRRELIERIGPWEEKWTRCSDLDYFCRSLHKTDAIYIDTPLTKMGLGRDKISNDQLQQATTDIEILISLLGRFNSDDSYQNAIIDSLAIRLSRLGWRYKFRKDFSNACKSYKKSLSYRFSLKTFANYFSTFLLSFSR